MKLSTKKMKEIVHEVVEEEAQRCGLDVNSFPITFIEYYTKYLFSGEFSLQRMGEIIGYPIGNNLLGLKDNKDLIVFVNNVKKKFKKDNLCLFELLVTVYHELRHHMVEQRKKIDSYETFLLFLEDSIIDYSYEDYNENHDEFYFEIDANYYGVEMAIGYLKKYYPDVYKEEKEYIDTLEEKYKFEYYMYDASDTFDFAVHTIEGIDNNDIFMNPDGSFKSVKDIMNNEFFKGLDERKVAAIMSSKTFLEETRVKTANFGNLSYEELALLYREIGYTIDIYSKQFGYLEKALAKKIINDEEYSSRKAHIVERVEMLGSYIQDIRLYMSTAKQLGEQDFDQRQIGEEQNAGQVNFGDRDESEKQTGGRKK